MATSRTPYALMQSLLLVLLFQQILVPVSSAPASLVPVGGSKAASESLTTVRAPLGSRSRVNSLRRRALAASQLNEGRKFDWVPSTMPGLLPPPTGFAPNLYVHQWIPLPQPLVYVAPHPPNSGGTGAFSPQYSLLGTPPGPGLKPLDAAPIPDAPVREAASEKAAAQETSTQTPWTSVLHQPVSTTSHDQPTYWRPVAPPPAPSKAAPENPMGLNDLAQFPTLSRNPMLSKAAGLAPPRPLSAVPDVPQQATPLELESGYQSDGLYGLSDHVLQSMRDAVTNLPRHPPSSLAPVNPIKSPPSYTAVI